MKNERVYVIAKLGERVSVTLANGQVVPGRLIAYDYDARSQELRVQVQIRDCVAISIEV